MASSKSDGSTFEFSFQPKEVPAWFQNYCSMGEKRRMLNPDKLRQNNNQIQHLMHHFTLQHKNVLDLIERQSAELERRNQEQRELVEKLVERFSIANEQPNDERPNNKQPSNERPSNDQPNNLEAAADPKPSPIRFQIGLPQETQVLETSFTADQIKEMIARAAGVGVEEIKHAYVSDQNHLIVPGTFACAQKIRDSGQRLCTELGVCQQSRILHDEWLVRVLLHPWDKNSLPDPHLYIDSWVRSLVAPLRRAFWPRRRILILSFEREEDAIRVCNRWHQTTHLLSNHKVKFKYAKAAVNQVAIVLKTTEVSRFRCY